jgi:hypothetical protein
MRQDMFGQPSYRIANDRVEAWITERGGHLAPVTFRLGDRNVQPFHVAPWAHERVEAAPILQVLRGDFFCLPFGANAEPFGEERHPLHGETANRSWAVTRQDADRIEMEMATSVRAGTVTKTVALRPEHQAVYVSHRIEGMSGPMTFGHHAMLRFQTEGLVATSPFVFGQVFPGEFEMPREGGYSSLRPGARFDRLDAVPLADGGIADLSRYPAREGFEDLVQVFSEPGRELAWNAVTFPAERYVWFALRDPRVLTGTILWHSNGGRHYAPWNGRHRRVLGIEDVTSYMHGGLTSSYAENDASCAGLPTYRRLDPGAPLDVRGVFGLAEIPVGFSHVREVIPSDGGIVLTDGTNSASAAIDLDFLR